MDAEIRRLYSSARQCCVPESRITLLHIGELETAVVVGVDSEPDSVLLLEIGSRKTAEKFFLHVPPSPGEIENAIQQVEDEITRARVITAGHPELLSADTCIREIARTAGYRSGQMEELSVEAIERVFSQLANYSLGRPASISGIPGDAGFAASLLILREFMHHLGYATIRVV
jgi:exopolyphosphatase/pppGpp-phosphohydrolase